MVEILLCKVCMIICKFLEKGCEMELKFLFVVVLDVGGYVIVFEKEDGVVSGWFLIVYGKVYGVVMLGMVGFVQMVWVEQ